MSTWRWIWVVIYLAVAAAGCGRADTRLATSALELYGVVDGERGDPRCRDYNGSCVLLSARPAVRIETPRYRIVPGEKPAIMIELSTAERHDINADGGRLAVVVDGRVLHVAKLRSKLGDSLMLSFCNRGNFERVLQALGAT